MESLLNRYRNITVLLLVIMAQLVLLAVDAKVQGVPLIRVWAVTAVTPIARVLEGVRGGGSGFLHNYVLLHDTNAENRRLKAELDKLKMENIALKNDLATADRAKALQMFQSQTPSKTLAATIIATGAGANSRVRFVDRGSMAGVLRGMAVVTPDGIVGKVTAAYPTASEVELITDPDFAAGVITQKGVRGVLKGQDNTMCKLDYVAFEDKIEPGEMLYTSGDDRVFPRGFPAGVVKSVRPEQPFKEVIVEPVGLARGLQDVLILIDGVHQEIPTVAPGVQPMYIAPAPPADAKTSDAAPAGAPGTEADRLRAQYKAIGEAQGHIYGENPAGARAVDFTKLGATPPASKAVDATKTDATPTGLKASDATKTGPTPVTSNPAGTTKTGAAPASAKPADATKTGAAPTSPKPADAAKTGAPPTSKPADATKTGATPSPGPKPGGAIRE